MDMRTSYQIIKIGQSVISGNTINSVNSRDIHKYLESKQDYSTWIKKRLKQLGAVKDEDYLFHKIMENEGRPSLDYIVTTDIAKHLGMMERNKKGKEVRNYFIEVEKKHLIPQHEIPQTLSEALLLASKQAETIEIQGETIKKKDEVILAVADLNIKAGDVSIGDFAKNLAIDGLGRNNMYIYLRGRGFLMLNNEPYQQYVERGYMKRKPYDEAYGGEVKYKTVLTPRGTVWLAKIIRAEYDLDAEPAEREAS